MDIDPTPEFEKVLDEMEDGQEYEIDYNNYIVTCAFLESPVCNVSDFFSGSTDGITLVKEPNEYNKHTLDLFEYCLGLQTTDLLAHELKIMSNRIKHLNWANLFLVPVLKEADYHAGVNTFFNTTDPRDNSNQFIEFVHPNVGNLGGVTLETDCLTGEPILTADGIDMNEIIYCGDKEKIKSVLLEKVWKPNELKYGYLFHNDPKETIDTYPNLMEMWDCIRYNRKTGNVDTSVIPDKYQDDVKRYNEICKEYGQQK